MTDKKAVPFATVEPTGYDFGHGVIEERLMVGGERCAVSTDGVALRALAVAVGAAHEAAVAAREANLREAIKAAEWNGALSDEPYRACPWCGVEYEFHQPNQKPHRPDCRFRAALDNTGPDVVAELRAQLAAARAEGPWMVLHDIAETGLPGSGPAR